LNEQHNILIVIPTLQTLRLDGKAMAAVAARAPQWVAGLMVVLLGARVAYLATDLGGAGAKVRGSLAGAIRLPASSPPLDLAALISANLFGSAAGTGQQGPAPVTSMPLVLVGVMAADDPERGVAILGPTAPAARVYLVGNTLPGGARLHAVYGDRVLLDRGGSIEALLLPRQSSGSAPAPTPPPQALASNGERMQQIIQQNPSLLTNVIRPQVVLADGRQKGFRVFPGPNRAAFNKLGLRPGDLVTAINGTNLDDPALGKDVFGTLSSAATARLTVVRDGRQQELSINVSQAVSEAERLSTDPAAQTAQPAQVAQPAQMGQPAQAAQPAPGAPPAPAPADATVPPP
jgi:general secretion pathway protein C